MKILTALLFLLNFASSICAQIKVDSNYTILARDIKGKNIVSAIEWDLNRLMIKENMSESICSPVSMQITLLIKSETFHAANATEAQKYMLRSKPGDKIFIDKIVLPSGCFTPPKQIVITVM